jgi:hypothetical protein
MKRKKVFSFSFLCLTIITSLVSCHPVKFQNPKTYFITNSHGAGEDLRIVNGQSVYFTIQKICQQMNFTQLECIESATKVSDDYYSVPYSPSRVRSTIEDFYADRIDLLNYLNIRFNHTSSLEIRWDNDQKSDIIQSRFDSTRGETFRMMSDEFFAQNDRKFDLIVLNPDNLSAEQFWNDIAHSLKSLNDGGTIVLHNLLPSKPIRGNFSFTRESWKAAVAMRLLPDYEIIVVDIDGGCGIIRKRLNTHQLPESWHRALVQMGPLPEKTLPGTHSLSLNDFEMKRETLYRFVSLVEMREWLEESP